MNNIAVRKSTKLTNTLLQKQIREARNKWLDIVKNNCIGTPKTVSGESEWSRIKTLYFVHNTSWLKDIEAEIEDFKTKLSRPRFVSVRKLKSMWLPTIIKSATNIHITFFNAFSSKRIDSKGAQSFAKEVNKVDALNREKASPSYRLKIATGRKYKLGVIYRNSNGNQVYLRFTDWAICVYPNGNSRPKITEKNKADVSKNIKFKNYIFKCKNHALFRNEVPPTH